MTDSTDRPITSPDFVDQPVLVTPNHIVRVKENEALSGKRPDRHEVLGFCLNVEISNAGGSGGRMGI